MKVLELSLTSQKVTNSLLTYQHTHTHLSLFLFLSPLPLSLSVSFSSLSFSPSLVSLTEMVQLRGLGSKEVLGKLESVTLKYNREVILKCKEKLLSELSDILYDDLILCLLAKDVEKSYQTQIAGTSFFLTHPPFSSSVEHSFIALFFFLLRLAKTNPRTTGEGTTGDSRVDC
jgi:hypothetical protein